MKQNLPYLKHILDEINFLLEKSINLTYEDFISDEMMKRGFARSFEIIGEAAKNLSDDFKDKYSDVEWKKISGMRDKIIHFYFGVSYSILWQTVKDKLPELKIKIEKMIADVT